MITCKELAQTIKDDIKKQVAAVHPKPSLAIITVGDDPASAAYVRGKIRDCEEVGVAPVHIKLDEDVTQAYLESIIIEAHYASGIILQLPVPKHLNAKAALECIDPAKDVDGLTTTSPFTPCTAKGIYNWLSSNWDLDGKNVVIINRSQLVGRPLAKLLLDANATVMVCHSHTRDLFTKHVPNADIVVVGVGKAGFLNTCYCKPGAIIVDVGINNINGKLFGDVESTSHNQRVTVTPVPGGVGLLTRACLLQNVMEAYNLYHTK